MDRIITRRRRLPARQSQDEVTRAFLAARGLRPTRADELTWLLGWHSGEDPLGDDRLWRHRIFARYTDDFGVRLAGLYAERYRAHGRRDAAEWLGKCHAGFSGVRFDLALDESRIKRTAEEAARAGRAALAPPGVQVASVAATLCARYQLQVPRCHHPAGLAARLKCSQWWRRNLRRTHGMLFEERARVHGLVSSKCGQYASDDTVARRLAQRAELRDLLSVLRATNELGDEVNLGTIFDHSESNPSVRRAALMARMAGFERIAKELGYAGMFYTITCPSRMHARLDSGGLPNPHFDGTTPRQAQEHLRRQFQKVRAKWRRLGIQLFGFRICEPHRDGTPHWHLLLFVPRDRRREVSSVLRDYALRVDPDEPGADEHRFRETEIDSSKGSATGYVAKYISKHLDGRGLHTDEHGSRIDDAIARVDAWASTWRTRQFQQIGGPPVGVWRELRRLSSAVDDVLVERARAAADAGDWATYFAAQGGPTARPRAVPICVWRVWSDAAGRYGEPKGFCTLGVFAGGHPVVTRVHTWTISVDEGFVEARRALIAGRPAGVRQGAAPGRPGFDGRPDAAQSPQPAGVPVSRPAASFRPWSSVNNCTASGTPTQLPFPIETPTSSPAVRVPATGQPRFWRSGHPRPAPDSVPPLPPSEATISRASADYWSSA